MKLSQQINKLMQTCFYPFDREQLDSIHLATLSALKNTGLRIDCREYHPYLQEAGADLNRTTRVVKFPEKLIEETIRYFKDQIIKGRKQYLLNGVTNPRWTPPLGCKFGGACIEYLDLEKNIVRKPNETDLIRLLQLGQALDDVGFVGNPVACLVDKNGQNIPPRMQRVKTASVVAKHTGKCGSTEVWNEKELDLLLEIGEIVRDGRDNYQAMPCFVTAKETITPLQFPEEDGKILLMLARRGLPCMIVPMPLTGASSPCSVPANIVMANAEILGVLACIHAAVPGAMAGGGVITGILDMSSAAASFAAPEAILQDAGLAQLYDEYYGQDLAIGTGYTDAKYPGVQAMLEKTCKMSAAAMQGRFNFPVGLLAGGKRFCPEQAILDLEIAVMLKRQYADINTDAEQIAGDVINAVGIGGEFLSHSHTRQHFRENMWMPSVIDRTAPSALEHEKKSDMLANAGAKVREIWARNDLYVIDEHKAKKIDEIVEKAEELLN